MAENGTPEFGRYLAIIREKRYLALAAGLAVMSIIVWGSFLLPKTYMADSTVFVQTGLLTQPFMKNSGITGSIEDELRVLKSSITSRAILGRVIRKLDMDIAAKNPGQNEELINEVRKNVNVTVKTGRNDNIELFTIFFESKDPKQARDFVNALVNEYIEQSIASRRSAALGVYTFLSDQMDSYKNKLNEANLKIMQFMNGHPDMMSKTGPISGSRLSALQSAEVDTQIKLNDLINKRNNLALELSGKRKPSMGPMKSDAFQSRVNGLNNELITLRTKYTDQYPEIIKVKAEIKSLKKQMRPTGGLEANGQGGASANPMHQQLKDELAQTDSSISSMRTRLSGLTNQERAVNRAAGSLPAEQDELATLEKDRDNNQNIYDELAQKLESAKVSKNLQMSDYSSLLRVVDPAVLPVLPEKPDRVKLIIMGLFAGLISGIGAAIGMDYLTASYRDEEALEKELRIPVLISIPSMTTEQDKAVSLKKDLKIFGAAGAYVLIVFALLVKEALFRYMGIRIF